MAQEKREPSKKNSAGETEFQDKLQNLAKVNISAGF